MSPALHLLPLAAVVILWYGIYRLNRAKCWFRTGEIIFWDAIILILICLVWLRWF